MIFWKKCAIFSKCFDILCVVKVKIALRGLNSAKNNDFITNLYFSAKNSL